MISLQQMLPYRHNRQDYARSKTFYCQIMGVTLINEHYALNGIHGRAIWRYTGNISSSCSPFLARRHG